MRFTRVFSFDMIVLSVSSRSNSDELVLCEGFVEQRVEGQWACVRSNWNALVLLINNYRALSRRDWEGELHNGGGNPDVVSVVA